MATTNNIRAQRKASTAPHRRGVRKGKIITPSPLLRLVRPSSTQEVSRPGSLQRWRGDAIGGRNPPTNLGDFRPESVLVRAPDRRSGPSATRHCFARRRRRPPGSVTRHGQKVPKDHSPSNSHLQHPPTPLFRGPQTPRFRRNEGQNRGCLQRHSSRHTNGPSVATHSSSEPPIPANAGEERRPPPRGEPHTAGNEGTDRRLHFCRPRPAPRRSRRG
jgi:hypothetical protein